MYPFYTHYESWTPDATQTDYRSAVLWSTIADAQDARTAYQTWDDNEGALTPEYIAVGMDARKTYTFSFSGYSDGITLYDRNGIPVRSWSVYEEDLYHIEYDSENQVGIIQFSPAKDGIYILYNVVQDNVTIQVDRDIWGYKVWQEYRSPSYKNSPLKSAWNPALWEFDGYRYFLSFHHNCADALKPYRGDTLQIFRKLGQYPVEAYEIRDRFRYLSIDSNILFNSTYPAFSNNTFLVSFWALSLDNSPVRLGFGDENTHFYIGTDISDGQYFLSINGDTGGNAVLVPPGKWFHFIVLYTSSNQTATAYDGDGNVLFTREGALASAAGIAIGHHFVPTTSFSAESALFADIRVYRSFSSFTARAIKTLHNLFPCKYK